MRHLSHQMLKIAQIRYALGLLPLVAGLLLGSAPQVAQAGEVQADEAIANSETIALKQTYSPPRVYRNGGRSGGSRNSVTIISPSSDSYWRSDRRSDGYVIGGEIEDSVLVNPIIIDSSIEDSTLINPVVIDSPGRVYVRRGHSTGRSSCLVLASHRAACR